jgi:NAD(P)-dependent dehydrogenase (short-subunit alcohol dehydrogenase family)
MGQFELSDRVALITGAGGRLGSAFAAALASAGARLVLTGRNSDRLRSTAEAVRPGRAEVIPADLSKPDDIEALFDRIERSDGGLDILVNNAGVARDARLGQVSAEDFHEVLTVNVVAAYLCAQRAAPLMRARGGGKVVNVGSIYGSVAVDTRIYEGAAEMVQGSAPYVASKSALIILTRDLAVRLAPWNIQVNMLSPGGVEADQPAAFRLNYEARTPAGRLAQPEDVTGTLVYLAASASDYVTGQNILVDGGFSCW